LAFQKKTAPLETAVVELLALEKKTRMGGDNDSGVKVAAAILDLAFQKKEWKLLNEYIVNLCKRRHQSKKVILKIIQTGMEYLKAIDDKEVKRELIQTLRTVSSGKFVVELERARLTKMLAQMKEEEGNLNESAEILQEVAVETIGSMEMKEKAEFLLEQLRLCLSRHDYVRTELIAKKVNTKTLQEEKLQDLLLRYYRLMIDFHLHYQHYLDICKAYLEIFKTQDKESPDVWKPALKKAVIFLILSPFDSEVSDLLHRLKEEKKMAELPECKRLLEWFTTSELINWPIPNEGEWKSDDNFKGEKGDDRWNDFHKRVIQHNLRVMGLYYSRITFKRLAQLLHLDPDKTESYLSEMVSSKQLYAKIDRPAGIVSFAKTPTSGEQLNTWSSDISELLSLVERTCHLINKENMVHSIETTTVE